MPSSRLYTMLLALAATASLTAQQAATPSPRPTPPPPSTSSGQANPKLDQSKKDVILEVDGQKEDLQRMNDMVFSFAEPGFQEIETTKYLTGIL